MTAKKLFGSLGIPLIALVSCFCEGGNRLDYVDVPQIAEALRRSAPELSGACEQGFEGFLEAASSSVSDIQGSETFQRALLEYREQFNDGYRIDTIPEPALFHLILQRFSISCEVGKLEILHRQLDEIIQNDGHDQYEQMIRVLSNLPLAERLTIDGQESDNIPVVSVELPPTIRQSQRNVSPVIFLACLTCAEDCPSSGASQIAHAVAALDTIASSNLILERPVQLLICLNASQNENQCQPNLDGSETSSSTVFALDGIESLVVAWSGEVSWGVGLPHLSPHKNWKNLALLKARRSKQGKSSRTTYVLNVGSAGRPNALPERAWMDLVDLEHPPEKLKTLVEDVARDLSEVRKSTGYKTEIIEDRVRLSTLSEPRPAWTITDRKNTLWDLAAIARVLRLKDPPRSSCAAILRVINRFDGDPYGSRLGLHYEDPVGGSLRVAPTSLNLAQGKVVLGIRMYRPPGMEREPFIARLDEARNRLKYAAGRPLIEEYQDVRDPSVLAPESEQVRIVQEIFETMTDDERPEISASPRPGLGSIFPDALSLQLPHNPTPVTPKPGLSILVEIIWQFAIATDSLSREQTAFY